MKKMEIVHVEKSEFDIANGLLKNYVVSLVNRYIKFMEFYSRDENKNKWNSKIKAESEFINNELSKLDQVIDRDFMETEKARFSKAIDEIDAKNGIKKS